MKKVLLTTVFILLLGLFVNPQAILAQCQCPNDIEPTNINWTSESATLTIYDDMNRPCEMEVNYCWREFQLICPFPCSTVVEIWVCNFTPTGNCHPDFTLSHWKIIERLTIRIRELDPNSNGWYNPPCNDPSPPNFSVYAYNCYDNYGLPCGGSVKCVTLYDVRMCSGQVIITETDRFTTGGDCPYGCSSKCDD